jgi:4-amino-4-deoxy-L-arabinose transferase-like glycosyltransferase
MEGDVKGQGRVGFWLALLLCTVVPIFALGLSNHGLWTADEPRVAEIGREMGLSGNWAVPTLNGRPFLEEPPLYYAALGATFRLLGVSDSIARLPSAVFAVAGVVALFFLGTMFFGPRIGFISGVIMATCGEYFRVAHWVIVDSALACFVIMAVTFFSGAYLSQNRGRRILFYVLCYVSAVLAFYTKGFLGVGISGLALLAFLVFGKDTKEIGRMHLWLGVLIFGTLVSPWFVALWTLGGTNYLDVFLIHNHIGRFAGGSSGHHQPLYYYLTQFPVGFLPWSILIIPVFYRAFQKNEASDSRERTGLLLAKCWFAAGFLILSVAATKRVLYLMPIFAPVCLMTAWYVDKTLKGLACLFVDRLFLRVFGLLPLLSAVAIGVAYFVGVPKYGLSLSWPSASALVFLCVLAATLSFLALLAIRGSLTRFWILSSASVYSLLVLGLVVVFPILDHYKSFVPFCRGITASVPPDGALYAYKPDETLRGAVPFYTGRFVTEVETLQALETAAAKGPAFVVIRDKRQELERELTGTGRFSVVARFGGDGDRSLAIFKGGDRPKVQPGSQPVTAP